VQDGRTGFLVPHGNVDAMTAALERLARDPTLVATMGHAGREFAETLTWDHAAAATAAHLAQVVGGLPT
jgi:glycosyltransferase involved in cell wall biosynthesis